MDFINSHYPALPSRIYVDVWYLLVPWLSTSIDLKSHRLLNKLSIFLKLRCTYIPWHWLSFCYHIKGKKQVKGLYRVLGARNFQKTFKI